MNDTCYAKGQKVILVSGQNRQGHWICRFTIPGLKEVGIGRYQGVPPGEYTTEWKAKTMAFEYAKRVLNASHEDTLSRNRS